MSRLADLHCRPLSRGTPPLAVADVERLLAELASDWRLVDGKRIAREWRFSDFSSALAFTIRIGLVAEREDHHPDIGLAWGRVTVELWTHTVGGLSENDFVLAAKLDALG